MKIRIRCSIATLSDLKCAVISSIVATIALGSAPTMSRAEDALRFVEAIPLLGVEGRIDHMAIDSAGQRLFVAALGNNTVEVVDLAGHKVAESIRGLKEPQGIAFLKDSGLVAVANGDDGSCRFFDSTSYRSAATIDFQADADNLRYDPANKRLYVGFGSGGIGVIDAASQKRVGEIKLAAHPESFQLESKGSRIFVNVPNAGHVAVIDRDKAAVVTTWPVKEAAANFPMALDEDNHRLFIGCRKPARLIVLDTETGKAIKAIPVAGDTDDVFYDAAAKRIYVSGGEGAVTTVAQKDADNYEAVGKVATAPGARTSFFDSQARILYVAVPHRGNQVAEIRVFAAE
jgi:YVTN family beta-propeller protein